MLLRTGSQGTSKSLSLPSAFPPIDNIRTRLPSLAHTPISKPRTISSTPSQLIGRLVNGYAKCPSFVPWKAMIARTRQQG